MAASMSRNILPQWVDIACRDIPGLSQSFFAIAKAFFFFFQIIVPFAKIQE